MAVERERGISVSSAVMSFEHEGLAFNLLDTPGHQDFSEDTYRTLTAVDSAVMVLDAAKGIEEQTHKLFEVCRLRDVPIITFVNKLYREGRDPFDLLDEIEQSLALDVTPASWPIDMGRDFLGTYDLFADALLLFKRGLHDRAVEPARCSGLDDPKLPRLLPKAALAKLREEVEMAKELCPRFNPEAYREGHLTGLPQFSAKSWSISLRKTSRGCAPRIGVPSTVSLACVFATTKPGVPWTPAAVPSAWSLLTRAAYFVDSRHASKAAPSRPRLRACSLSSDGASAR
jgi:peptide subunit release factor RF-3